MSDVNETKARVFDFLAAIQSLRYKSAAPQVPLADQKPAREELASLRGNGTSWDSLAAPDVPEAVTKGCFPQGLQAGCLKYLACRQGKTSPSPSAGQAGPSNRASSVPKTVSLGEHRHKNSNGSLSAVSHSQACETCSFFACVTEESVDKALREWKTELEAYNARRTRVEPQALALAIDRLCPYFYSQRLSEAQSEYAEGPGGEGNGEIHSGFTSIENPFRFLQCFLAMNNEGRARRLVMPGMPLEDLSSREARRCAEVLEEEAGISGIAIIGRDDLHKKTYHLQGGSRDPGVAHYYEIPDFWFGEDKEPVRRGFHHVLRIAFHAARSTSTEEAPELHKYFNRRTSSIRSSPFERRIGVLYCPDGELTFAILHWRLLLFANACSTSCKEPAMFQDQLRRLRLEILAAIDRPDIKEGGLWAVLQRMQVPLSRMACQADLKVLSLLADELRQEKLEFPESVGLPFPGAYELDATPVASWSLAQELVTQSLCDEDGATTERFLGLQAWLRGLRARTPDDSLFPEGWPLHPDLLVDTAADLDGTDHSSVAKGLSGALAYWEAVSQIEEANGEGCLDLLMSGFRFPHLPYYLWRSKGAFALGHLAFPVAHSHMSMPDEIFVNNLADVDNIREEKGGAIGYFAAGFREDLLRSHLLATSSKSAHFPSYYNKEELTRSIRTARLLGEALGAELAAVNFSQGFLAEEFHARHAEREAFVETTMHYLAKRLDPLTKRLPEAARDLLISAGWTSREEFFELYERGANLTIEGMVLERLMAGMRKLDEEVTRNQWLDARKAISKLDLFFSDLRQYISGDFDFHLCHWNLEKVKSTERRVPLYAIYRILYAMVRNYDNYFHAHARNTLFCGRLAVEGTCTVCGCPKRGSEISIDFDAADEALVIRQRNPFIGPENELADRISKGTGIRLDIVRVASSKRLFSKALIAGPRVNTGFFEMEVKLWL